MRGVELEATLLLSESLPLRACDLVAALHLIELRLHEAQLLHDLPSGGCLAEGGVFVRVRVRRISGTLRVRIRRADLEDVRRTLLRRADVLGDPSLIREAGFDATTDVV